MVAQTIQPDVRGKGRKRDANYLKISGITLGAAAQVWVKFYRQGIFDARENEISDVLFPQV
jgi:hypothetical protein